jgi:glycosyltransferase involved in cell wall biosynthesis
VTQISHLLPVRNGSEFLQSVIPQIVANFSLGDEIIVIDDGSTDETPKLLQNFKAEFKGLEIFRTKGVGLVAALNLGFDIAECSWVARYDVDDDYEAHRIEIQKSQIKKNTVGIFSDYDFRINKKVYAGRMVSPVLPQMTKLSLFASQQTAHPVALLNKSAVQEAGGYNREDFPAEDLGLWFRLAKLGDLISVPETLLHYNLNSKGISASNRNLMKSKASEVVKLYSEKINLDDVFFSVFHDEWRQLDNHTFPAERRILALRNLFKANPEMNLIDLAKAKESLLKELVDLSTLKAFTNLAYFKNLRTLNRKLFG